MSVLRKSAVIVAVGWLGIPLSLVTAIIVARVLGPEGVGALFLIDGLQMALTAVFGLGLPAAAAYFIKEKQWSFSEIAWTVLLLTLMSSVAAAVLVFAASKWVLQVAIGSAENIDPALLWIIVISQPLIMAAVVFEVLMVVEGSMKIFALKGLGPVFLTALLTVLLVLVLPMGLAGAVMAQCAGFAGQFAIALLFMSKKGGIGRPVWRSELAIRMLTIGVRQSGNSVLSAASKRLDGWIVASVLGIGPAGLYSVANQFRVLFANIPRSLMWPLVGDLEGGKDPAKLQRLARVTRLQNLFGVAVCVVCMPLVALVVPLLFGGKFAGAVPAAMASVALIAVLPVSVSLNALFVSMGRPGLVNLPLGLGVGAQYLVAVATLPYWGILGAAIGVLVCHALFGLGLAFTATRLTNLKFSDLYIPRISDLEELRTIRSKLSRKAKTA
jgi:O-antigen/teichoic acid export membrane protein